MGNTKSGQIVHSICIGVLFLLVFAAYGIAMAIYTDTLVDIWLPVGMAAALGLACALWTMRPLGRLTGWTWRPGCYMAGAVALTGFFLLAFFAINYACADEATLHTETVTVERLYTETRYRTKRINRRTYGRGEPYKVYFMTVAFESGRRKEMQLTAGRYRSLAPGRRLEMHLATGAFGVPVIKD